MGDEDFLLHDKNKTSPSWAHTWDDTWIKKILVSRFSSTHTYKMLTRPHFRIQTIKHEYTPQHTHGKLQQYPSATPTWITRVCPLHCSWSARQSSKSVRCKEGETQLLRWDTIFQSMGFMDASLERRRHPNPKCIFPLPYVYINILYIYNRYVWLLNLQRLEHLPILSGKKRGLIQKSADNIPTWEKWRNVDGSSFEVLRNVVQCLLYMNI